MFEYSVKELKRGIGVHIAPKGTSMRPLIKEGDQIYMKPIGERKLRKGDVVLSIHPVTGENGLFKIEDIKEDQVIVSNNEGKGWMHKDKIYGFMAK